MQKENKLYDLIGIGIGPFNLGLSALSHSLTNFESLFFDQANEFNWHAGMMLDRAKLQVPFYADLVTLADPCSPFTYLNFLKSKKRLFRFAIKEDNFIYRSEYNEYCRWVVDQLTNCKFGFCCESVSFDEANELYVVTVRDVQTGVRSNYSAKHLVIGVGSVPSYPSFYNSRNTKLDFPAVSHSSDYLHVQPFLNHCTSVCVIGSGQSAAEIFLDLLQRSHLYQELSWFTSAHRFYPMEYSKLSLEMTSPDYIEHFYHLPDDVKMNVLRSQSALYKGINFQLINEIYDELYLQSLGSKASKVKIHANVMMTDLQRVAGDDNIEIKLRHKELDECFSHFSQAVILATGYEYKVPQFLGPVKELINWSTADGYVVNYNYSIDRKNSIYIQNAELHSHGFNAPDLGMGPYRNAVILNSILGKEQFVMERKISFQTFGLPDQLN